MSPSFRAALQKVKKTKLTGWSWSKIRKAHWPQRCSNCTKPSQSRSSEERVSPPAELDLSFTKTTPKSTRAPLKCTTLQSSEWWRKHRRSTIRPQDGKCTLPYSHPTQTIATSTSTDPTTTPRSSTTQQPTSQASPVQTSARRESRKRAERLLRKWTWSKPWKWPTSKTASTAPASNESCSKAL